ncbi:MAG: hypothetical protein WDA41_10635 [Candidatus Neomarinimicrobiota bacterium]|jgi:hypothetical protein
MNPITGEAEITIAGQAYSIRYDWAALAEVEAAHGQAPNLFSPDVVASVAAAGLKRKHPDMTAERIKELSPPLVPLAHAVQTALQWAYFGDEGIPEDTGDKKKATRGGLSGRIKRLFRRG